MNAQTKPAATILDLDAMMDQNMDEVETLPDFVQPPAGIYDLICTGAEIKAPKEKGKPSLIQVTYKVEKTHEVVEGQLPVADGSLFSERFQGTEEGLKFFKKAAANILGVSEFEGAKLRDVMDGLKDAAFKARITTRKSKNDEGKEFENINIRAIREEAA
ncbi:MAG: hypothetical protein AB7F19_07620 [Candidatus Babeliales bacterium]